MKKRRINKSFVTGRREPDHTAIWKGPPVLALKDMSEVKRAEMVRLYGPISTGPRIVPKQQRRPKDWEFGGEPE